VHRRGLAWPCMATSGQTREWPGAPVFCERCGHRLERQHVHGMERGVCPSCRFIAFRTPSIGVAVVLRDDLGRLLLIERSPGSSQPGKWAIPAGYLDYGEDVRAGAAREALEETGLTVDVGEPVFVQSNWHDPAKLTVGIWFEATIISGTPIAGDDATDVGWFFLDALPELAFDTDAELIERLSAAGPL